MGEVLEFRASLPAGDQRMGEFFDPCLWALLRCVLARRPRPFCSIDQS
jgi:hypothetical protein